MTQYTYYLISDIHLEKKNEYKKSFLLESINELIEKNKKDNKETIIVCAGDIDNGTKAYDWLKKINAQIIYIAGNHEFWNNDYYDTLENLQKEAPDNVTFMHNSFIECGDYLVIGATMWTDVGKSLNEDLKYVSNGLMNDNHYITAKKWYNDNNINKLSTITNEYSMNKVLEKKGWNILIEQEENAKTIHFLKEFCTIRNQLIKFQKLLLSLNEKMNSQYSSLSVENHKALKEISQYERYSYKDWLTICKDNNLLGYAAISNSMINFVSQVSEEIFKKLIKVNVNKKILIVSHHLPFLEERLIGYYSHIEKAKKLYNKKADSAIYTIRDGLNYPEYNYFYRIEKGEFSRDESIVEAVHYSNNGAMNIPTYVLEDISAWCHGHDHTLNYQDYIKNVSIVTNPMSYSLDVFIFSEKAIELNDSYKQYHKIDSKEKEIIEIEKLKQSVLRPIKWYNDHKNKNKLIKLWVLSLMDIEKIHNFIEKYAQNNKKMFTYLAKNAQFSIGEITEKQIQKIQDFMLANYYYDTELKKQLNEIDMAYSARQDIQFSYMNKMNKIYSKDITEYFMGDSYDNITIDNIKVEDISKEALENGIYDYLSNQIFNNIYYLNKAMKRVKHVESILKEIGEVDTITDLYDKFLPDLYPKEPKIDIFLKNKLQQKRIKIMEKYMTQDVANVKEERNKNKYDF